MKLARFYNPQPTTHKLERGFTLAELIVSIAIIALISSLLLANSRSGERKYSVELAGQEFVSYTRLAQHLALSSRKQNGTTPYGYGIYTEDSDSYALFYNPSGGNQYSGTSEIIKRIDISPVSLSQIGVSLFFVPPYPIVYIDGVSSLANTQTFTFSYGDKTIDVVARGTGRIGIE